MEVLRRGRAGESSPMRGMSSESSPSVAFGKAGTHNLRQWAEFPVADSESDAARPVASRQLLAGQRSG